MGEVKPYDLSAVRPAADRVKVVIDEAKLAPGEKENFFARVTDSLAGKGVRTRCCGPKTAGIHWQTLRTFLGFVNPEPPVVIHEHLAKDREVMVDPWPWSI